MARRRFRHLIIAVGDVDHVPRSELGKAQALARASRARLDLFHAIDPAEATAQRLSHARIKLERIASTLRAAELQVAVSVVCDRPAHEAVIRHVLATEADLVVAGTRPHIVGARLVLRNTDWELIRHCPCPVLLVKAKGAYRRPAIIAAVDPFHAHAKPANLDTRLLQVGAQVAELLGGALHAFHAYRPLTNVMTLPAMPAISIPFPPELEQAHAKGVARVFDHLAAAAGIAPAQRHLNLGPVGLELSAVVKRTHAAMVVMGAVSRSALERALLGSTCERVLDHLSCDVLVVKPRSFETRIARRGHRGAIGGYTGRLASPSPAPAHRRAPASGYRASAGAPSVSSRPIRRWRPPNPTLPSRAGHE